MNKVQFKYKNIWSEMILSETKDYVVIFKLGIVKGSKQDVSISCKISSLWELTAWWTLLNFKQNIEKKVKTWKHFRFRTFSFQSSGYVLHDGMPNSKYRMMAPFRNKARAF